MRMTNLSIERNFLYNIGKSEERLQRLQDQASSGMNFQRPQDDPVGVERSVTLRNQIVKNQQYLRNLDKAKAWMEHTEQALSELTTVIERAQEIGLAGATGTTPQDARNAVACEVHQLWEEVGALANRTMEGRLVLRGAMPTWRIGPGLDITPDDLTALLDEAATYLADLETGLKDPTADPELAIRNLEGTGDKVLAQRATNGARVTRVETFESKMTSLDIEYQRLLSNAEDVDITQVIVRLRGAETAYQAALGAGAKLIQPSLLDYLK